MRENEVTARHMCCYAGVHISPFMSMLQFLGFGLLQLCPLSLHDGHINGQSLTVSLQQFVLQLQLQITQGSNENTIACFFFLLSFDTNIQVSKIWPCAH